MSAGLAASTVTPGSTAPLVSLATPTIPAVVCATATTGRSAPMNPATTAHLPNVIATSSPTVSGPRYSHVRPPTTAMRVSGEQYGLWTCGATDLGPGAIRRDK